MMKPAIAAVAVLCLLAACEGHQYEPREPGVTVSGQAGVGIKYENGKTTPHSKTKVSVSLGGSI
ncbi:hypothetical protein SAMN04488030_3144 [Aliiroseovarius halocynthiae]|uniref:Uncharacterized protein n=1 Tax=Aliiroseovarius halocynthiae TaxID=985055 RepID=A0A545SM56_9RHOB|nr:hypothetical protein [Aliiroseovarius halocynthiae]TQV66062.1 hypothetical protein FIL88_14930 [Aliiroseovarius halocynthiae]SMR83230.1 hypothetical protein SAMN04488030_3144 [Aliiroseovarius halocynthiae]